MPGLASRLQPASDRGRLIGLYGALFAINFAAWGWAAVLFRDQPVLLGTALLAYSFGLRHAVDADHIAAIDNVTRTIRQSGRRPMTIGLYFALGHSIVVVLATVGIAVFATVLTERYDGLRTAGSIAGTLASALFLFAVAAINGVIFLSTWRSFRQMRRGENLSAPLPQQAGRGIVSRLLRPLFRMITQSWHMMPLGFLFGLGFDTATEIGLLGLSATQATRGMSTWSILVFPALFAAGMMLVDTTDGILMLGVYDWAFVHPLRKLYYNLTITLVSVGVALLVGGIEMLGLIGDRLGLDGSFWIGIAALNESFGMLGAMIIAVFAVAWIGSMLLYRYTSIGQVQTAKS